MYQPGLSQEKGETRGTREISQYKMKKNQVYMYVARAKGGTMGVMVMKRW